jgi:hypothetical protein
MTPIEIAKVQEYLRRTFDNQRVQVRQPKQKNAPIEVHLGQEFIGVLHRDEDEGEISYALHITILQEDLE